MLLQQPHNVGGGNSPFEGGRGAGGADTSVGTDAQSLLRRHRGRRMTCLQAETSNSTMQGFASFYPNPPSVRQTMTPCPRGCFREDAPLPTNESS